MRASWFDVASQPLRFAGKLNAVHSLRHRDIAEQEIKCLVTLEHLDSVGTIPSRENLIAKLGQHRVTRSNSIRGR